MMATVGHITLNTFIIILKSLVGLNNSLFDLLISHQDQVYFNFFNKYFFSSTVFLATCWALVPCVPSPPTYAELQARVALLLGENSNLLDHLHEACRILARLMADGSRLFRMLPRSWRQ